jgi:hypothetical protein
MVGITIEMFEILNNHYRQSLRPFIGHLA